MRGLDLFYQCERDLVLVPALVLSDGVQWVLPDQFDSDRWVGESWRDPVDLGGLSNTIPEGLDIEVDAALVLDEEKHMGMDSMDLGTHLYHGLGLHSLDLGQSCPDLDWIRLLCSVGVHYFKDLAQVGPGCEHSVDCIPH